MNDKKKAKIEKRKKLLYKQQEMRVLRNKEKRLIKLKIKQQKQNYIKTNILIAGMAQSGSTRLYNCIIKIYEQLNYQIKCGFYSQIKQPKFDMNKINIFKIHHYTRNIDPTDFDYIILPIRDVRDSSISTIMRHNLSLNVNTVIKESEDNIKLLNEWIDYADCIAKYEEFNENFIKKLLNDLKLNLNNEQINTILLELNNMHNSKTIVTKNTWDDIEFQKTLLSQSHNTSGGKSKKYKTFFTYKENQEILNNENIKNFLQKYNYIE